MSFLVATDVDDRRHIRASWTLTECGRYITPETPGSDWPACHICLPDQAHPMEPVWALCRRYDDNANAGAGEPRGTS